MNLTPWCRKLHQTHIDHVRKSVSRRIHQYAACAPSYFHLSRLRVTALGDASGDTTGWWMGQLRAKISHRNRKGVVLQIPAEGRIETIDMDLRCFKAISGRNVRMSGYDHFVMALYGCWRQFTLALMTMQEDQYGHTGRCQRNCCASARAGGIGCS